MAKISKGDFVEVEYTGRLKENNQAFDTTDEATAKKEDIYSKNMRYTPAILCVGESLMLKGLEDELIGKEPGKYKIELSAENAFGKKDAKLIKMIPYAAFKKQDIEPQPGMEINVDGTSGLIKTAAGGRCLVDFNHPLSGKDVFYEVKINRIVTDDAEKIKGFMELSLNLKKSEVTLENGKAKITTEKEIPKPLHKIFEEKLKQIIPSVKEYEFLSKKPEHQHKE